MNLEKQHHGGEAMWCQEQIGKRGMGWRLGAGQGREARGCRGVFRSQDYNSLLYAFKQLFEKVEVTKPVASRATSAEIYVICLRYRAPAKIDPRLLDVKHLFQDIAEPPQIVDVLRGTKQKRHREGYEEGNTTLWKECSASNFIWAEKPLELLGTITSIIFKDPVCATIRDHSLTTEEVKLLCEDLRVLGKQEFKQLLKWRLNVRKALAEVERVPASEVPTNDTSMNDEDILNEMEELKALMQAKTKQEKKRLAKRKAKAKARAATGMKNDVMEDGYADGGLFNLASIKGKKGLQVVELGGSSDENIDENDEDFSDIDVLNKSLPSESFVDDFDIDSDIERQKYDAELEKYLDLAYDRYRKSAEGSTMRRKRAKLSNHDKELWQENDVPKSILGEVNGVSSDGAFDIDHSVNPLVVSLEEEEKLSRDQIAKQWFSQDIFVGFNEMEVDNSAEGKPRGQKHLTAAERIRPKEICAKDLKEEVSTRVATDDGFEVVPAETSGSHSSSDEEEYDADSKAEILAYAKKMLRKKNREDILDDGYNRYTFNDVGLPDWFADDEKRHCQPIKPISKEEVEAMKAQFNAINTRPVKKVAEAKARKKRRALKKLEGIKQKVTAIADQPDMSAHSKKKMMERLYKKAEGTNKPKKELIVAKKGMGPNGRRGKTIVDRRMKKDKRSHGAGKPVRRGKSTPARKQGKGKNFNHGKQRGDKRSKAKGTRPV
ncbi:hypothetical protein L7F22_052066 [Adiantum nelumboides]|nr:hypothetical protein [Adiantum nelumboides]